MQAAAGMLRWRWRCKASAVSHAGKRTCTKRGLLQGAKGWRDLAAPEGTVVCLANEWVLAPACLFPQHCPWFKPTWEKCLSTRLSAVYSTARRLSKGHPWDTFISKVTLLVWEKKEQAKEC